MIIEHLPTTGDVWDGSIEKPEELVQRDGISYYEITKCSQLAYVAQTEGEWLTYNYILGNNLILNDVVLTWDGEGNCTNRENLLEWTPIGKYALSPAFSGNFLGNGYTISGMYITTNNSSGEWVGFFGESGGYIDGVTIVNSYVSGSSWMTGGLVGYATSGTISNCSFSGAVKGKADSASAYIGTGGLIGYAVGAMETTIINATNYATVFGTDQVAGIVGHGYNITVYASCNYGDIEGNADVGGIIGLSSGTNRTRNTQIKNCYNLSYISGNENVGGIAGNAQYSNISSGYNAGIVGGAANFGSIIGRSDHFLGERSEISNCYYLKTTLDPFGNVSGDTAGVAEGLTDTQMKQQSNFVGWDFNGTWAIDPAKNGGYPYLLWQTSSPTPVNNVSLNKKAIFLSVGDKELLTATVTPADTGTVSWDATPSGIVELNTNGNTVTITAKKTGTASITATIGGQIATCNVTVTAASSTTPDNSVSTIYRVIAYANPSTGGYTVGGGYYSNGEYVAVRAIPVSGYDFVYWIDE